MASARQLGRSGALVPRMTTPFTLATLRSAFASHAPKTLPVSGRTPAAVLVPFLWHGAEARLVFNRRTMSVPDHKGQIAFPGGRVEPEDADAEATALREAHEEIGLAPDAVEIIGRLDDHHTRTTNYHLTPVAGVIRRVPHPYVLDPREVAEVFEVPLSHLLDSAKRIDHHVMHAGREIVTPGYRWDNDVIWGATGAILDNLLSLLREAMRH